MHRDAGAAPFRKTLPTTKRGGTTTSGKLLSCKSSTVRTILLIFLAVFFAATMLGARHLTNIASNSSQGSLAASKQSLQLRKPPSYSAGSMMRFHDFKALAMDLVRLSPEETLKQLEQNDPFGTRAFEKRLEEAETTKGRILTLDEIQLLFPCPRHRVSLPERRNQTKAQAFRQDESGTFLFFQHLRKAGGTHFCSLAERNLPKEALPSYYCMPDYHWTHSDGKKSTCAGCLSQWSNQEITSNMKKMRIAGNEWDKFEPDRHFELEAVFATSFRRPLDRALSQYRFECVEDRGCKYTDVGKWWKFRTDLRNVYTWTFSKTRRVSRLSLNKEFANDRAEALGSAIDTVAQFNLVLSMEWIAYAETSIQGILGFMDTSAVTQRVRPHITQAKRTDNQEHNVLGAAGIAKASWTPKDYLTPEQYKEMSEGLAMDEVLTDVARRLFLERLVCHDMKS
ncbi:hypothetical protein MPSEU_000018000 [Mayamaea pseudoterrestris]|nr:hypothetical protein MPSEU_000018000 [Mayamaea pseudoterrestris]